MATGNNDRDDCTPVIILLTLAKHERGIWITQLEQALKHQIKTNIANIEKNYKSNEIAVEVVTLERLLTSENILFHLGSSRSPPLFMKNWCGVVNRVSDAANPVLMKHCLAVLHAVQCWKIPVFNGPMSYAQCCNKWLHHVLFHRAGLETPSDTYGIYEPDVNKLRVIYEALDGASNGFPHLIKPNSGGFGSGIHKVDDENDIKSFVSTRITRDDASNHDDNFFIYQPYIVPNQGNIFRVWFLMGRVQCAVVRSNDPGVALPDEFTTGCAASGVCSRVSTSLLIIKPYDVPIDVIQEIEKELLPLLPDAHCGSIEYLHDENGTRLYFDLNLLSSLPLITSISTSNSVWDQSYDPWDELANSMLKFILGI